MMHGFTVVIPSTQNTATGGYSADPDSNPVELGGRVIRVLDDDFPTRAADGRAAESDVSGEVDHRCRRTLGHHLGGDDVGREALADASRVECRTSGNPHTSICPIDGDLVPPGLPKGRGER